MTKKITRSKEVKTVGEAEITEEYEEEKSTWIEVASSYATIAAIIGGFITAWVALCNYSLQREKEIFSRERETKKPFFEKQAEFYFDAVEVVSKIATGSPQPSNEDIAHFWKIYWGRLAAVEDNFVDNAMVLFGNKLTEKSPKCCLNDASLLLVHCVKKSLEDSWKVQLGAPPEFPCEEASFQQVKACNLITARTVRCAG
jgi:hypothetical protein